ncbi:unnamed protein product [Rotaria sordida]|uniref:Uncharacterized protein n=1 Tax=Rotaria sordida TaxID=392033 RepID=A0A815IRQ1_9BILA|nr:unnamed protein product [Rotaria sordida]CAF1370037.1 unnamed protein product [Rotaria sordida]
MSKNVFRCGETFIDWNGYELTNSNESILFKLGLLILDCFLSDMFNTLLNYVYESEPLYVRLYSCGEAYPSD